MTSLNVNNTLIASTESISSLPSTFFRNNGVLTLFGTVLALLAAFFFHVKSYREAVMKRVRTFTLPHLQANN